MRLGAKKVEAKFDDWGDDWEKEEPEEEETYAFSPPPALVALVGLQKGEVLIGCPRVRMGLFVLQQACGLHWCGSSQQVCLRRGGEVLWCAFEGERQVTVVFSRRKDRLP